jgi:ribulose 1,5-bisphosphate synthetase/thiazole synthase
MVKSNVTIVGAGGLGLAAAQTLSAKLDHSIYNLILLSERPFGKSCNISSARIWLILIFE